MKSLRPEHFGGTYLRPPLLLSEAICCSANIQSSRLTDVCPAITRDKMFLFWPLYILVARAWSWLCRKVNSAAAGAAQHGEKWFSAHTRPAALRPHSNHTLWNSGGGRPKQRARFIFKSEFMVVSAFLKSVFNFDLGLLIVFAHLRSGDPAWERSAGLTGGLFTYITATSCMLHV